MRCSDWLGCKGWDTATVLWKLGSEECEAAACSDGEKCRKHICGMIGLKSVGCSSTLWAVKGRNKYCAMVDMRRVRSGIALWTEQCWVLIE